MAEETFEPRRAKPGQVFTYTTGSDGEQRELRADNDGVVRPTNAADAAALDGFGLSVARKAMAEDADADEPVKSAGPDAAKGGKG